MAGSKHFNNGERCIKVPSPASYKAEVAAFDQHSSLVSVCPPKSPTLPARRGRGAVAVANVWMCETDWHNGVCLGLDVVFMCTYDCGFCVCAQVWCSGLGVLQRWLSPSEPTLAPVCWSAMSTCTLTVRSCDQTNEFWMYQFSRADHQQMALILILPVGKL